MEADEYFAPLILIRTAYWSTWPAVLLAVLLAVLAAAKRLRLPRRVRCVLDDFVHPHGVLIAWPVYAWAFLATVNCILIFDVTGHIVLQSIWAFALSQFIALALVLSITTLACLADPSGRQRSAFPLLGPLFAIGAVATDWLCLLTAMTPFER